MIMRYFISDIHLFHRLMLREEHRGFSSFGEMHDVIVYRWNKVVKATDQVYIIGDFTFGKYEETKSIMDRLNGTKYLIKGNHDRKNERKFSTKQWLDLGFSEVMDEEIIKINMDDDKIPLYLKHYPYQRHWLKDLFSRTPKEHKRTYHQLYPKYTNMWHIHGHIHGGDLIHDNEINVSWETLNGRPISENDIIELVKQQEKRPRILRFIERILGRKFFR